MCNFCKTKSDEEKWNKEDLQHRLQKISEMNGTYLVMLRMLQSTGGMLLERNTITSTWAPTVHSEIMFGGVGLYPIITTQ